MTRKNVVWIVVLVGVVVGLVLVVPKVVTEKAVVVDVGLTELLSEHAALSESHQLPFPSLLPGFADRHQHFIFAIHHDAHLATHHSDLPGHALRGLFA